MRTAAQGESMEAAAFSLQATGTESSGALRQTVAERLARHRSRRAAPPRDEAADAVGRSEDRRASARSGVSRVRDAVAARYEKTQSYREYLAAEAERALQQAQAEAEIAARKVRAVADAQIQLLEELEQWNQPDPGPREQALAQACSETRGELARALADIALGARELMQEAEAEADPDTDAAPGFAQRAETAGMPARQLPLLDESPHASSSGFPDAYASGAPSASAFGFPDASASGFPSVSASGPAQPDTRLARPPGRPAAQAHADRPLTEVSSGGLRVRLYDALDTAPPSARDLRPNREHPDRLPAAPEELSHLDAELELRHAASLPVPHTIETTPIPANLIEFPRQLIASRKARPRLAEGPLREEAPSEPQLRIFEVAAEQIATQPAAAEPTGAPVWQELQLESSTAPAHVPPAAAQTQFTLAPQVAPIGKRLFAATVDGLCLLAATAGFLQLAFRTGGAGLRHAPLPLLGAAAGVTLLAFFTLYQMLFFTLNESTPGMRAARIALCTFGDDNPSRPALRRRVLATLLAACPLGIGLFWCLLDGEELGWHDRMSRMYQRAY